MNATLDPHLPPVPQTGRQPAPRIPSPGLWNQLRSAVNQIGSMGDPFIGDLHPTVSDLGRQARMRHPRIADDYFALGDLCARLVLSDAQLNQSYCEKAVLAYNRAGECSSADEAYARRTILAFTFWVVSVARMIASAEALQSAIATCEQALKVPSIADQAGAGEQLRTTTAQMRAQLARMTGAEAQEHTPDSERRRLSRKLCDEGQAFLRTQRVAEALSTFERAIEADDRNSTAWLWRALALTDVARFDEALESYDQAINIDPTNYGAWNAKGTLLMELGRAKLALECFDRALDMPLPPPIVKAAFLLSKGKALYTLGRYEEARDALVRSDQLDSTPESVAGVAACREMLERIEAERRES